MTAAKTFTLTAEEMARVREWQETRRKYAGAIGGQFTYEFTPTSVGDIVRVRDNLVECAAGVLDLTDYDSF